MKVISLLFLLASCASVFKGTEDPIQETLGKRRRQFLQCYLESDSYLGPYEVQRGKISVAFTILAKGTVKDEKIVESSFEDANLHACVIGIVKRLQFPPAKDGLDIEVTQPISFHQ